MVKEGGFPIAFMDSVLRNLLRGADFLPVGYVIGLFVMAGDSRFRRLGDRVAGTMVVVEERGRVAAPLTLTPPPTAAELEGFPQRPPLSASERETLELYLRRVDLTAARREELAQMIAPALAQRIGVTVKDPVRFLALLHHRVARDGAASADRGPVNHAAAGRIRRRPPAGLGGAGAAARRRAGASASCRRRRSRARPASIAPYRPI